MDVAIRDAMVPEAGTPGFFRGVRELGVSAVEIEVTQDLSTKLLRRRDGSPYSLATPDDAAELRRRCDEESVRACAFLLATDFSGHDPERTVEWVRDVVERADEMAVPVVRIDPLALDRSIPQKRVLGLVIRHVCRLLELTSAAKAELGLENHGPFANDPAFFYALFDEVRDHRLGLTLDTGNFYWFGFPLEELYDLIEQFASRVKHTHVKNIHYPPELANVRREVGVGYKEYCCALDEGNIDLTRVVRILRVAGYDRDLCIENESLFKHPPEKRSDVLRRDVAAVRAAMAAAG